MIKAVVVCNGRKSCASFVRAIFNLTQVWSIYHQNPLKVTENIKQIIISQCQVLSIAKLGNTVTLMLYSFLTRVLASVCLNVQYLQATEISILILQSLPIICNQCFLVLCQNAASTDQLRKQPTQCKASIC